MFEFAKIKAELEEVKCPVHGKAAKASFVDGQVKLEDVCCEAHWKALGEQLPEIEDKQDAADILEDVY
jgi:hypothetical protein